MTISMAARPVLVGNCALFMLRALRGERYQMRPAMREVTITFVPNGREKAARPSGTREGGAIGEFGFMRSRRSRTTLKHTDTKKWLVSPSSLPLSLSPYLGSKLR